MAIRLRSRKQLSAAPNDVDRASLPNIQPAPSCRPTPRSFVTVAVPDWGKQMTCRAVRMDLDANELLLALPEHLDWSPHAKKGLQIRIGWPDHGAWHESLASFSMPMAAGTKFLRLEVSGIPVHHERRRHFRLPMIRPIRVSSHGTSVKGTTINVSEAAIRLSLPLHAAPGDGDSITATMRIANRHTEEMTDIAFDGHVLRSVELSGHQAGTKEIVVLYDTSSESQADAVRGLVFELGLQERIRQQNENPLV